MFNLKLSALAAVALVASTPAFANGDEQRSVNVNFADLDLSSAKDLDRLERRVRHASASVCDANSARGLREREAFMECYGAALADGRNQIDGLRKGRVEVLAIRLPR